MTFDRFHMPPAAWYVLAVATLLAGEAVGFSTPRFDSLWPWEVGGAVFLAFVAYGWNRRHLLWGALFLLGVALAARTEQNLHRYVEARGRPSYSLKVLGDVSVRMTQKGRCADFVTQLGPIPLKVALKLKPDDAVPRPGEIWACRGWLSDKKDMPNRYARRTLWVQRAEDASRLHEAGRFSPYSIRDRLRCVLSEKAQLGLSAFPELAALNRAILLGARSELKKERRQVFVDAGTIHVFAISGLHVMTVAALLIGLLRLLQFPLRTSGFLALPLVAGYVFLTGARPSAIRAGVMASLMLTAPLFNRRADPLIAWSLTALWVYLTKPYLLFDCGCSLSFAVMFGIALWLAFIRQFEWPVWAFGTSLAAWAAGVPIAAHVFGRFTAGGLLANLIVLPAASGAVIFGGLGLVFGFICPPLAIVCNLLAAGAIGVMVKVSEWVALLPYGSFSVTPWSFLTCAGWYGGAYLAFRYLPPLLHRLALFRPREPEWVIK